MIFVVSLIILVTLSAPVRAATYQTKDTVGFTGSWTPPTSSSVPSTQAPPAQGGASASTLPNTDSTTTAGTSQKVLQGLPKTGDTQVETLANMLAGATLITFSAYLLKKSLSQNQNKRRTLS